MYNIFYSPDVMEFAISAKLLLTIFLVTIAGFLIIFKRRNSYLIIANIILTLILVVNTLYYRHFNDFMSINLLNQINQIGEVSSNVKNLFKFTDLFYFLDYLLIFIWIHFNKYKKKFDCNMGSYNKPEKTNTVISHFLIPFVSLLCFVGSLVYVYSNSHYFEIRNANRLIVSIRSMYYYNILDTVSYMSDNIKYRNISEDELKKITEHFNNKSNKENADNFHGLLKGKNVLFIQEESLSQYLINKEINGQEITPNINKLIKESYYNNNFYSEVGGGHSADTELISLTGLYPLKNKSANLFHTYNDYDTLVKTLKDEGYYTFSAHSYRKDFWNREIVHKQYGFDVSYFQDSFNNETDKLGWGITDEELFKQTIQKLKHINTENKKPFFGYIVTLQNHTPFDIDNKYKQMNIPKEIGTELSRNYIQVSHNVDNSIGVLIEELKNNGLYDNTAIVIFGDHDAELNKEECKGLVQINDKSAIIDAIKSKKVPFIIHVPNVDKLFNIFDNKLSGQTDILPTISNLLGVKNNKYSVGHNLFSNDNYNKVVSLFRYGVLVTDKYAIENGIDKRIVYDINSGKTISNTKETEDIYSELQTDYECTDNIIGGNLMNKLKELDLNKK